MRPEWIAIIAASVGAVLGIAGEWIGRISSRRHEERTYARSRDEWERQQEATRRADDERAAREREIATVDLIVATFREQTVGPLRAPDSTVDAERALGLSTTAYYERLRIRNTKLRELLGIAAHILEVVATDPPSGLTTNAVVYIVRTNLYMAAGAWYRGEDFPETTADWQRLEGLTPNAIQETKSQLAQQGIDIRDYRYGGYL